MKLTLFITVLMTFASCTTKVIIVVPEQSAAEIAFGTEKLKAALEAANYNVELINYSASGKANAFAGKRIVIEHDDSRSLPKEGYTIASTGKRIHVKGNDPLGALYACMELSARVNEKRSLTFDHNCTEHPQMQLRGACVGRQPYSQHDTDDYEAPYTPEDYPWFYDKDLWTEYLDMLVENKMNTLYLWSGNPFASLVQTDEYPNALAVDSETFKRNEDTYSFLIREAQRRGIRVIQNICRFTDSDNVANAHSDVVQFKGDYIRKMTAAFVEKYPEVGLLVGLGRTKDALDDYALWLKDCIIVGMKDGLLARGRTDETLPLVVQVYDAAGKRAIDATLPLYANMYTLYHHHDEASTVCEFRKDWDDYGAAHISSVQTANLTPFRYSSPAFIQRSVRDMRDVQGANALHLYPLTSHYDYPYTTDRTETDARLKDAERNHLWYAAWGRYAWNADRDRNDEISYWSLRISNYYGCGRMGKHILDAYEESGEIVPKLLHKFGINESNRQTLLLGLFVNQLVNPYKWSVDPDYHKECNPAGRMLHNYMEKEWKLQPYVGETPPQLVDEAINHAKAAVDAIEQAAPYVKRNQDEFNRLRNDMYCYQAFANYFAENVKAAMNILHYTHSDNLADLDNAIPLMEKSLAHYTRLAALTKEKYLHAGSIQDAMRHLSDDNKKYQTWEELLPHYEAELNHFRQNVAFLKQYGGHNNRPPTATFRPINVRLDADNVPVTYVIKRGEHIFSDAHYTIGDYADELRSLMPYRQSLSGVGELRFVCPQAVNLLVGYFNTEHKAFAPAPHHDNYALNGNGNVQANLKIINALAVPDCGTVNIHAYRFDAGSHRIALDKGGLIVFGFIDGNQPFMPYIATLNNASAVDRIDWLFY